MATKPGPAVALAALAALFLLKGKGGKGGAVDKNNLDNLDDGTDVPDDTPNKPASPSGGGKKVPKGTGGGGGSWDPGKIGPTTFWISPDCRNVIEGPEYYDKVLVPAMLKVFDDLDARHAKSVELGWEGGSFVPDLYNVLAVAQGFREITPASKTPFATSVFADTEHAKKPPGSCLMEAPMFHVGPADQGKLYQAGVNGIAPASEGAFNDAVAAYFGNYPQMSMWLYSTQERMVQDQRLPEKARDISSLFDLSFLIANRPGAGGNPPERAPDMKVWDLFDLTALGKWWALAQAYIQKWAASHPKAISEYQSFVSDWWEQQAANGTKTPVGPETSPEDAAKDVSPASTGILLGRVVKDEQPGVTVPQPIANAGINVDGKNLSTDNEGYFEVLLPAGWHPLSITVGPAESTTYVTIEAGQTSSYDFQSPV